MKIKRNEKLKALYVHVPFCHKLCTYCDFAKLFYYPSFANHYLDTLEKELDDALKYETIYIGGGTPTSLNIEQFSRLMALVSFHLDKTKPYEFCVELNPENCDETKIKLMKDAGVNRVSIGVQTFSEKHIKNLNRAHLPKDVTRVIQLLLTYGIFNISCDLIYGLPQQSILELQTDLHFLLSLPIQHISLYPLTIENNTLLKLHGVEETDPDVLYKYYQIIKRCLKKAGYKRYEVSNFARPGFESKHNMIYWTNKYYRGVGPGASGYEKQTRYQISRNFTQYFQGVVEKKEDVISDKDYLFEYVMLHLRTKKGIDLQHFFATFQVEFKDCFKESLTRLVENNNLVFTNKRVRIREKFIFIEHQIVAELLKNL